MKNIYCTSDSFKADMIVNKLSDNGINALCSKKENFDVVTGKNNIEFEISVDDWEADKAKKLLGEKEYRSSWKFNKKRVTAIVSLVFIAAVLICIVASMFN